MMELSARLVSDEEGAVTVDWVALTALVILLAITVVNIITQAAVDPADGLGAKLLSLITP